MNKKKKCINTKTSMINKIHIGLNTIIINLFKDYKLNSDLQYYKFHQIMQKFLLEIKIKVYYLDP